jgi:hypothetical protein
MKSKAYDRVRVAALAGVLAGLLATASLGQAPTGERAATSPAASWAVDPREREVGESFEVALVVPHARNERVELDASALEVDPSWCLASAPRSAPVRDGSGVIVGTHFTWSLASFEPGERDLPQPKVTRVDASGRRASLELPLQSARFTGLLAQGEDEVRPALGFRPLEPLAEANSSLPWVVGGVLGALAACGVWLFLRRRKAPRLAPPSSLQQLADLEARPVETREAVREVYYELTALVRGEFDARAAKSRAALTDREWLASVSTQTSAESVRELEALFAEAEQVKYAAQHPTHWAVRESLAKARRVLEALGEPQRRAA